MFSPLSNYSQTKKKPFLPTVDKLAETDEIEPIKFPAIVASAERIENVTP